MATTAVFGFPRSGERGYDSRVTLPARLRPCVRLRSQAASDLADGLAEAVFVFHQREAEIAFAGGSENDFSTGIQNRDRPVAVANGKVACVAVVGRR